MQLNPPFKFIKSTLIFTTLIFLNHNKIKYIARGDMVGWTLFILFYYHFALFLFFYIFFLCHCCHKLSSMISDLYFSRYYFWNFLSYILELHQNKLWLHQKPIPWDQPTSHVWFHCDYSKLPLQWKGKAPLYFALEAHTQTIQWN